MADQYLLRVTAGPSYDPSSHQIVNVNTPHPTKISSEHCEASISIRIQNYRGLPAHSPPTSPYFSQPPHTSDQYSISFTLTPSTTIPGPSLIFGNDFDHPIRDRLPPGFSTAFRIVRWAIDPGLDGDVYSDTPHLYGPAGSSLNILRVGEKTEKGGLKAEGEKEGEGEEQGIEEGGDGSGSIKRHESGMPDRAEERKKWFLKEGQKWEWEEGRVYRADFFNPYLDFNSFALKLPGFSLSILPYLGGEDYLRYVLKNKDTGDVLFVVVFTLLKKDEMDEGEVQAAEKTQQAAGEKAEEAKKEMESLKEARFEGGGGDDDVD